MRTLRGCSGCGPAQSAPCSPGRTKKSGKRWAMGSTRIMTSPRWPDGKNAMHPRITTLIAYGDGETGAERSRRIAKHLSKCEKCHEELRRIEREKDELSEIGRASCRERV